MRHDLDIAAFESEKESAETLRMAFDGEGNLIVAFVVHDDREDVAIVWRRIAPDGQVSQPTRIPLPDRAQRMEKLQSLAVTADGTTYLAHRTLYREDWVTYGEYFETPTEILRISRDGALTGSLSLGARAYRAPMVAHGNRVDVAFQAWLTGPGDLATWWQQIGPDGTFTGSPVRLSAPAPEDDPDLAVGIWDLFLGVSSDGAARVLYRRVVGRFNGYDYDIIDGPEVFWHSVSPEGSASSPVSLGRVPDGPESWKPAFAPDGTVLVCTYDWLDTLGTSFPPPLLVLPGGEVRPVEGQVMPAIMTAYPGQQFAVGADAASNFRVAVFGTPPYLPRPGRNARPMKPSVFLATVLPDGTAGPLSRTRIRRPQHIWSYAVADDGSRAIAGDRTTRVGRHPYRIGDEITFIFADPEDRCIGRVRFRNSSMTHVYQPVLATTSAGGHRRFAAAWTPWLMPDEMDKPENRQVRVVLFE